MFVQKLRRNGSSHFLAILLETKNEQGMTAFLVACLQKEYALIELLVDAGTDLNAADLDGNTAISLIASSIINMDEIPSKDVAPEIFKVHIIFSIRYRNCLLTCLFSGVPKRNGGSRHAADR